MKTHLIILMSIFFLFNKGETQSISFEYLPPGTSNGTCTNISDDDEIQCYDVIYVPGATGTLTSYTLGFLGSCTDAGSPILMDNSTSCVMTDNSSSFNGCAAISQILMNLSGNTGSTSITAGVPISLHQVCFTVPLGEVIDVVEEETTGLTFSIDSIGSGAPVTDLPTFADEVIYNESDCEFTEACTLEFGSGANVIEFATLADGTIANGASLNNSIVPAQSFNVFDEVNMSCVTPGGIDDITFNFSILNTTDINDNGIIDEFAGDSHRLIQTADGITGSIPFNATDASESSAGDVRGYVIEVHFAEFVNINADQLSVMVDGLNSKDEAFEAAALIFLGKGNIPFGTATHQGYYDGENDLSGDCNSTTSSAAFIKGGTGVVLFQDFETVDLSSPCSPVAGIDGVNATMNVNARTHGELDSATLIGGFKLIVYGEDVAAPDGLDDGSGIAPDDNIRANAKSNTETTLSALIKGIKIEDCVQFQSALPLDWNEFSVNEREGKVNLDWSTYNEINTESFEIEWSTDAVNYQNVGKVESQNRVELNEYKYVHDFPSEGRNYYRIKQIDRDGQFSFSEIELVGMNVDFDEIKIYPNPTTEVLNIRGVELLNSTQMKFLDVRGSLADVSFIGEQMIDVSRLPVGLYTIVIQSDNKIERKLFYKQ